MELLRLLFMLALWFLALGLNLTFLCPAVFPAEWIVWTPSFENTVIVNLLFLTLWVVVKDKE